NAASGINSTVGGGVSNAVSGFAATVGGGSSNTASGNYATVGGGVFNEAIGSYSFAAGRQAKANNLGAFVWADSTNADFTSTADNQFAVRATGGVRFVTNSAGTTGCSIAAGGGSWNCTSDRNAKANITPVDPQAVLNLVAQMPIVTWNYLSQADSIRHMGPMAQDFHAAFGLGENNTSISMVDADGVALAAIQGLHQLVEEQQQTISTLESKNAALQSENAAQQQQLDTQQQTITAQQQQLDTQQQDIELLKQQMTMMQQQLNER
ncbi:MAG: hypothetical protein HC837_04455, partial [Chloroflexaceae bacterium]|nr:hypothetical protein [Chloroflexaceae bacterium]